MITHFLGETEVSAYAKDFANRLTKMKPFPSTWIALGISGMKMVRSISEHLDKKKLEAINAVETHFDRQTGAIKFDDSLPASLRDHNVLVIDSAVHSGSTMQAVRAALCARNAKEVISYSLVTKLTASHVPSFFGVVVGDHDRTYFQLDSIPNNRLQDEPPFGNLRLLDKNDLTKPFLKTGVESLDKNSFADYWYDAQTRNAFVYIFECAQDIAGMVSFSLHDDVVFIDLVANDEKFRGKGVGASLMRWAETWARHRNCLAVDLWAIRDRISFYEKGDFESLGAPVDLGGEIYQPMRKRILYNIKPPL